MPDNKMPDKLPDHKMPANKMPVDKGWAWVILIGSFGVHFLVVGFLRSFGMLFVLYREEFGASAGVTSLISGVQACSYSVATLVVVNLLMKFYPARTLCLIGSVLQALGIGLTMCIYDINYMVLTQGLLHGVGQALLYCPTLVTLSAHFNKKRPIATAIATCGVSVGGIVFPVMIRYLVESYGFRGGLLLLSSLILQQCVCSSLFYQFSDPNDDPYTDPITDPHIDRTQTHTYPNDDPYTDPITDPHNDRTHTHNYPYDDPYTDPITDPHIDHHHPFSDHNNSDQTHEEEHTTAIPLEMKKLNRLVKRNKNCEEYVTTHPTMLESHYQRDITGAQEPDESYRLLNDESPQADDKPQQTSAGHQECDWNKRPGVRNGASMSGTNFCDKGEVTSGSHLTGKNSTEGIDRKGDNSFIQPNDRRRSAKALRARCRCKIPAKMKTVTFWVTALYFWAGGIASSMPSVFLPPLAAEKGMTPDDAAHLLMTSAVTEIVGRLTPGLILHVDLMRPSTVVIAPLITSAIVYMLTSFYNTFLALLMMAIVSGFCTGTYWAMQSLVVIELFGFSDLGPVLGFYSITVGVGTGLSYPLAGYLRDVSGTYISCYSYFGGMYVLAAATMIVVQFSRTRVLEDSQDMGSQDSQDSQDSQESQDSVKAKDLTDMDL